jgi:hypothetical protein
LSAIYHLVAVLAGAGILATIAAFVLTWALHQWFPDASIDQVVAAVVRLLRRR